MINHLIYSQPQMEHKFSKIVSEHSAPLQSTEQDRRALGGRALLCKSCGREQPPISNKGYVKVPVKVKSHREVRSSKPILAEPVMIRDAPSRKLASEANNAEKKARLDADHSFYRAIARRRAESR